MQKKRILAFISSLIFSLIFSFIFSFSANAAEKLLSIVASDIDTDFAKIIYEMDQDERQIIHLYLDTYHNSQLTTRNELKADELKGGIILNQKDKIIIVRMYSDNYDSERGGIIYLDTLYNGLNGERREYMMDLAIDKNGPVLIQNKIQFHKMNLVAKRSKVFGVIGIEKVKFEN